MNKRFSKIIITISSLVLALVFVSGCSFVNKNSNSSSYFSGVDSKVAAQSVDFTTTAEEQRVAYSLPDAVAKVERSSVMIEIGGTSAGSGVIIDISFDDEGEDAASWKQDSNMVYIITCHHMVSKENTSGTQGVGEITVYIPDENCNYDNDDYIFSGYIGKTDTEYAVTLVGGDYESDIALLRLDLSVAAKSGNKLTADKIVKAQIPDISSDYSPKKGETVFSIGNPTGTLPGTVAGGVISYLNRETSVSDVGNMTLMQIDVSTNPGSSGGGLYNIYGELIGITNAGNTNYTNINFAIPCYLDNGNGFVQVVAALGGTATDTNYGYVSGRKVKFGFTVTQGTDDNGTSYLYVSSVTSGSISANKGLYQGDEIMAVTVKRNGETLVSKDVATVDAFSEVMKSLLAGDEVTLTIKRTVSKGWRVTTTTTTVAMVTEPFSFCN